MFYMYSSLSFSKFTELCNHRHKLGLKYHHPERFSCAHLQSAAPPSHSPDNHQEAFSLEISYDRITQYADFYGGRGLASLTQHNSIAAWLSGSFLISK